MMEMGQMAMDILVPSWGEFNVSLAAALFIISLFTLYHNIASWEERASCSGKTEEFHLLSVNDLDPDKSADLLLSNDDKAKEVGFLLFLCFAPIEKGIALRNKVCDCIIAAKPISYQHNNNLVLLPLEDKGGVLLQQGVLTPNGLASAQ
eukprot:Gb_02858 [translate_table: standard]